MSKDIIYREDAINLLWYFQDECCSAVVGDFEKLPSADRPTEVIYGNEHNCIMTIFGKCSYAETGCGDCAVVEKVRKALSADRPQGEWVVSDDKCFYTCQFCNADVDVSMGTGIFVNNDEVSHVNYCPNCGARMKGADDE